MECDRILSSLYAPPTLKGECKRRPWTLPLVITKACDQKAVLSKLSGGRTRRPARTRLVRSSPGHGGAGVAGVARGVGIRSVLAS